MEWTSSSALPPEPVAESEGDMLHREGRMLVGSKELNGASKLWVEAMKHGNFASADLAHLLAPDGNAFVPYIQALAGSEMSWLVRTIYANLQDVGPSAADARTWLEQNVPHLLPG